MKHLLEVLGFIDIFWLLFSLSVKVEVSVLKRKLEQQNGEYMVYF